ncbi:MAG: tetratricopeptide repeat protein [Bdellovibrionales bacterium]|nr:tetratricopeptide repeat protein [Bdellovibrionales bacterium]
MCTQRKVLASTSLRATVLLLILIFSGVGAAKEDEYFSLPPSKENLQIPQANLTFSGKKFSIAAGKREANSPSVDTQRYLFEKQTFLTARRDQAIKLLRQELASGYAKNRDNVLLRLGQLYTEKYMELNFHELEMYNAQLEEYDKAKAAGQKVKKAPKLDTRRSKRYLTRALETLTRLEKEYPKHPRMDEVLYFLGFVNLEFGRTQKGAAYLERLVRSYPKSRKYDEAILVLADFYFDNQKFAPALAKYQTILRRKDSDLANYALYKIAWCQLNLGQSSQALANMQKVVEKLEGSQEKLKFNLRDQAINDLALFYADAGQVGEAFNYYKKVLGEEKAYEKLKLIAESVHNRAQGNASIQAHKKLLSKFDDSLEGPEYAMKIYESQMGLGENKEAVAGLVTALQKYGEDSDWARRWLSKDEPAAQEKLESLRKDSTNAAYFFHRTAQKSKKKFFYGYGFELYEAVAKAFPSHPDRRKLVFYQAEILYQQGKFLPAADRYMVIAKNPPKDKLAEEAAYNALLAVDQLTANSKIKRFTKQEKQENKFERMEIPDGEKRFIEVSEFYLSNYSKFKRAVDVKFRIAGIYYRYHHFDKAAPIFKEISTKYPKHKNAVTSAHLLLDIYNINKDYASLGVAAGSFANESELGDGKFRSEMRTFQDQIGFKTIEKLEKDQEWEKAGDAYYNYYRSNPKGKLAEQSLYNAVVTLEKTQNVAKQTEVTKVFMQKYPNHPYNTRLTLLQAKKSEEGYDFETAQMLYERFAEKTPKDPQAKSALYNAAVYAEVLGQNTKALNLYNKYLATARPNGKERKDIQLSEAELYRRTGNWRKVADIYSQLSNQAATLAERVALLGRLADLYGTYGRKRDREQTLSKIGSITRGQANLSAFGSDAKYVAESNFVKVEPQKTAYARLKLRLPPSRLVNNLKQKQAALKKLDSDYEKIVALGEPEWGVAALSERAMAYADFVTAYRSIDIPNSYKGEQRKDLETQLKTLEAEFVVPFESRAKELAQLCKTKAVEFHVASNYVQKCRTYLAQNDKDVTPSGLLPQPAYWTTRWGNLGGTF